MACSYVTWCLACDVYICFASLWTLIATMTISRFIRLSLWARCCLLSRFCMCVFSWISRFFVVVHKKLVRNCGSGISQLITLLHEAMTYDVLVKMKLFSMEVAYVLVFTVLKRILFVWSALLKGRWASCYITWARLFCQVKLPSAKDRTKKRKIDKGKLFFFKRKFKVIRVNLWT